MGRYLYNGVELPALPEWDKEQYPYAFITHINLAVVYYNYTLHVYSSYRFATNDKGNWAIINVGAAKSCYTLASTNYDAWGAFKDKEDGGLAPAVESTVVWSNFDVLTEDGTLYLAASDPVPVTPLDHTALTQGWIVGKRLAAMRTKRKPVAYLYNGVRLPALPVVEGYDFTLLQQLNSRWYKVWVTKEQPYVEQGTYGLIMQFPSNSFLWDNYDEDALGSYVDRWLDEGEVSPIDQTASSFVWSNTNILNEDETVYLAASDPVPIYE